MPHEPTKSELRERVRRSRAARSPAAQAQAATDIRDAVLGLPEVRAATTIAAYVGVGTEPGTRPLLDALLDRRVRVLLPVLQPDWELDWAAYTGAGELAESPRGLLEPLGERLGLDAVATSEVLLVPALAVDRLGNRLGRGGGAYDRTLARLPGSGPHRVIAVVFADEVLAAVPVDSWDMAVSAALTPQGIAVEVQ